MDETNKKIYDLSPEEWVLAFMYAGNKNIVHGKLMFIKQFFIATKEIIPRLDEQFRFYPCNYGPYSRILAKTIENLIEEGYIKSKKHDDHLDFFLSDEGKKRSKECYEKLPQDIRDRLDRLRLSANQMGYTGILRYVYTRYPSYASASKIREDVGNDL